MRVVNIESYDNIEGVEYVKLSEAREKLQTICNQPTVWITKPVDYGLCYQKEHPINIDRRKDFALNFESYAQELGEGTGMDPVYFTPRCNVEFCKLTDEYSVKIDTWTHCTYDLKIPTNLKWFMPNCNVNHPRIYHIPFGVNKAECDVFKYDDILKLPHRKPRLYLNFSEHTFQRRMLNIHFANKDWAYVVEKDHPNSPAPYSHQEYLFHMSVNNYVLCPTGVGLDSHRVWEALYLGCVPVMERDHWNSWMEGRLPVILVDDFYDIDSEAYLVDRHPLGNYDTKRLISEEYWRNWIQNAVR